MLSNEEKLLELLQLYIDSIEQGNIVAGKVLLYMQCGNKPFLRLVDQYHKLEDEEWEECEYDEL